VPQGLKRTLTSLQIAQFVFGASYAAAHLFIAYDIPVATPYQIASTLQRAASSISSAAAEASTTVSSVIETPSARVLGPLIKKLLLRAAGEEGLAERVRDDRQQLISPHIEEKIEQFNEQTFETRWRTDYTKVQCIDTTGEAFAIYLNLLYLAPLTFLFLRFFVKAYTQRGKARSAKQVAKQTVDSSKQAEEETEQYIERSGEKAEDEIAKRGPEVADKIRKETADLHEQLRRDVQQMKEGKFKGSRRVSDRVASFEKQAKSAVEKAKEKLTNGGGSRSPTKNGNGTPKNESAIEEDEPQSEQQGTDGGERDGEPSQSAPSKDDADQEASEEQKADEGNDKKTSDEKPGSKGDEPTDAEQKDDAKDQDEDKENQPPKEEDPANDPAKTHPASGAGDESEKKQDENIEASQDLRPGADAEEGAQQGDQNDKKPEDEEENSDAMGQSGSIIDMAKEKANDASDAAKDKEEKKNEEDPTAGALPAGEQWKPPGSMES
jgi:hypothetical protein